MAIYNVGNIYALDCQANKLSDISFLTEMTSVDMLFLSSNLISDITALSGLEDLDEIDLGNNLVTDLAPLVDTAGIGDHDILRLYSNPLSETALDVQIPTLEARGVIVYY
jgi:internalin A